MQVFGRMFGVRGLVIIALALVLAGQLAFAGHAFADAGADCNDGTLQTAVKGCSLLIEHGKLDGDNLSTALLNRAIAYASLGKMKLAQKDIDRAIKVTPENPLLFYNRGNLYFDAKRFAEAAEDFSSAIKLDGTFAMAFLNRGLSEQQLGNVSGSISDLRRALELDPSLTRAREEVSRIQGNS